MLVAVGAALAGTLAAAENTRELWVAAESAIAIDGDFSDWEQLAGSPTEEGGFHFQAAWQGAELYLRARAEGGVDFWQAHAKDFFNFGIDLGNDSDFSYEADDFHFLVGAPDEDEQVSVSLIRTGAASVETIEVIDVAGKRTATSYQWELSVSLEQLGGGRLRNGQSIGFRIERRGADSGPGPFLMPILWGDLALVGDDGQLSSEARRRVLDQQAEMAERYRNHQADPAKPERIDEKTRQDLQRLANRFIELQEEEVSESEIDEWIARQLPDGRWPEFEYGYTDSVSATSRMYHLYRLRKLAHAREKMGLSAGKRRKILKAVYRGIDYTIAEDLWHRNWYYNEIGYPLEFARIGLYLRDDLEGERRESVLNVMRRAKRPMTGQNLIWINKITMIRGLLEENPALVERAIQRIAETVQVEEGEGLQADFSFHQHGAQLYSHGYGAKFVADLTEVMYMAHGGRFRFSEEKRELVLGMLLDGNRWMVRGTFADFGALGRMVSVEDKDSGYLAPVAQLWLEMEDGRERELERLIASTQGKGPDLLEGNRYFYRSEFMVHRREAFYASVKAYSKFLTGTESINRQGLKSYYLPDGSTFFVQDGEEYKNIQAIWDWRRIPGVTGVVSEEPIPEFNHRVVRTKGNTDFVGGASDGWRGAAVYDYQRDGVKALKSYFAFDWGMVMLGAGIESDREEPLQTSVEQRFAEGSAYLLRKGASRVEVLEGIRELGKASEPLGVWHDGALYYLPEGQRFSTGSQVQKGSWRELRQTGSPMEVEGNVFSLTLAHGVKPQSGNYEYAVLSAATREQGEQLVETVPYRVLANTKQVQAVADTEGRHRQFVFHQAGRCELADGAWVAASERCVLLVSQDGEGEFVLTAADPSRRGGELVVSLGDAEGRQAEAVFHLPRSSMRGGDSASLRIKVEE
ncbi:polysaccharide lyase family 8 super-sandwich domain-containing protein [Pelagicoccus enzymogenes]|uniref:polysaccharide lyase family 8 super-sandwich domain-containing protein n=1 Tax=Pelagicoccus enzymogenes TaxID=2773457 RepID=UPI0028106B9B|nr:polysaccharide lyase family 8 super-sandwich domain-containing protein [Pelagicoccus enzymogenes]MDQ8197076.1 polysaccharide lyase family 8 super-sandwich domain-containing protein [Pelagicoccus enzymogenes]